MLKRWLKPHNWPEIIKYSQKNRQLSVYPKEATTRYQRTIKIVIHFSSLYWLITMTMVGGDSDRGRDCDSFQRYRPHTSSNCPKSVICPNSQC